MHLKKNKYMASELIRMLLMGYLMFMGTMDLAYRTVLSPSRDCTQSV